MAMAWLGFEMAIKILLKSPIDEKPIKKTLYNMWEAGDSSFTMICGKIHVAKLTITFPSLALLSCVALRVGF